MTCIVCGKEIENAQRSHRKYCSPRCRLIEWKKRKHRCPKCGHEWLRGYAHDPECKEEQD